ncbi:MAG: hypothetical protein JWN50_479, partial [Parcubacteria group bacterium]|nr:hypothetical protein [Parcubacteria group bacterium]
RSMATANKVRRDRRHSLRESAERLEFARDLGISPNAGWRDIVMTKLEVERDEANEDDSEEQEAKLEYRYFQEWMADLSAIYPGLDWGPPASYDEEYLEPFSGSDYDFPDYRDVPERPQPEVREIGEGFTVYGYDDLTRDFDYQFEPGQFFRAARTYIRLEREGMNVVFISGISDDVEARLRQMVWLR